jgi:hypothetical protein
MPTNYNQHPASWRDPSGYIFEKNGELFRQVNNSYKENFLQFSGSLYEVLVSKNLLIPHSVIQENLTGDQEWHTTLKPEPIAFITYPYEWSFDMLKDAALLTLEINKQALINGMILKDATPYNVQWHNGKMIFIDSLSFEKYDPDQPWIAYHQFCECFLAPLLLSHYTGNDCTKMLLSYPEGIPLALASKLLPRTTRFALHVYLHIHLHASVGAKGQPAKPKKIKFTRVKMERLLSSLEMLIRRLKTPAQKTTWSGYYDEASQRDDYLSVKTALVNTLASGINFESVADFGANKGEFAKYFSGKGIPTIASDADPFCVNSIYKLHDPNLQPVVMDLASPTPATGLNNTERASFISRAKVDLGLALALIHHLSVGRNIPFEKSAAFFKMLTRTLVIEFVPVTDEKIKLMLANKKNIYSWYTEAGFENSYSKLFHIVSKKPVGDSGRIIYLMKAHEA